MLEDIIRLLTNQLLEKALTIRIARQTMLPLGFNFNWQSYKSIVYNQLITAIVNARMGGTITVDVDFVTLDRGIFIKMTPD